MASNSVTEGKRLSLDTVGGHRLRFEVDRDEDLLIFVDDGDDFILYQGDALELRDWLNANLKELSDE